VIADVGNRRLERSSRFVDRTRAQDAEPEATTLLR
jgi:hypothetical protein